MPCVFSESRQVSPEKIIRPHELAAMISAERVYSHGNQHFWLIEKL
jgi:hypothetical protein